MNECPKCQMELEKGMKNCPECAEEDAEAALAAGPAAYLSLEDGSRLDLFGEETLFGRLDPSESIHPDVDLAVHGGHELGVSRRHLIIECLEDEFRLQDLGSTNGTIVNRERIQPGEKVTLAEGDTIYLGRLKAVFHRGQPEGGTV
ncbi:MAG: FHA domain-containing protein [bacterium]|nr:MAG: FHA domain-containing protein [bacterium]